MADCVVLNDGTSLVLLNDGTSCILLNEIVTPVKRGGGGGSLKRLKLRRKRKEILLVPVSGKLSESVQFQTFATLGISEQFIAISRVIHNIIESFKTSAFLSISEGFTVISGKLITEESFKVRSEKDINKLRDLFSLLDDI